MHLAHLVDSGERGGHLSPLALRDLEHRERRERVPNGGQLELRREPEQHPAGAQPVQPGLYGAPRDPEPAGAFEHSEPRLVGQQQEQPRVQCVRLNLVHQHS